MNPAFADKKDFLQRLEDLPNELSGKIIDILSPKPGDLVPLDKKWGLSEESFASVLSPQPPPSDQNDLSTLRKLYPRHSRIADVIRSRQFVRVATRFELGNEDEDPELLSRLDSGVEHDGDLERLESMHLKGLSRLKATASIRYFAQHVKQFSYMIPRFYPQDVNRSDFEEVLTSVQRTTKEIQVQLDRLRVGDRQRPQVQKRLRMSQDREVLVQKIMERADIQKKVLSEKIDLTVLTYAFHRFTKLEQIRLMPSHDRLDIAWDRFIATDETLAAKFGSSLPIAFRHGAQTLTSAIQSSGSKVERFSTRAMDLGSPLEPDQKLRQTISDMATRFKSLDLQFVPGDMNIDDKIRDLTNLFSLVFQAASTLQCIHIGFSRRVSIPLSVVFHDFQFKGLRYLGIHEWHLHSEELIELLARFKGSLVALRLRHVSLKDEDPGKDGTWRRVLEFIRMYMKPKWISLRGIGYEPMRLGGMQFGLGSVQFGNRIYRGHSGMGNSEDESSDESDFEEDGEIGRWSESGEGEGSESGNEGRSVGNYSDMTATGDQSHDSGEDSATEDDHDDNMSDLDELHTLSEEPSDTVLEAAGLSQQVPRHQTITILDSRCRCYEGYAWEMMTTSPKGDNGVSVTRSQWKEWQIWAVNRCKIHDPPQEAMT